MDARHSGGVTYGHSRAKRGVASLGSCLSAFSARTARANARLVWFRAQSHWSNGSVGPAPSIVSRDVERARSTNTRKKRKPRIGARLFEMVRGSYLLVELPP